MERIPFRCSSCQQAYRVPLDKAGLKTQCIKCGAHLTIPTPAKTATTEARLPQEDEDSVPPPFSKPLPKKAKPRPRPAFPVDEEEEEPETQTREKTTRSFHQKSLDADAEDADSEPPPRRKRARARFDPEEETAEEESSPRKRPRARKRTTDWRKVRIGLLLMIIGMGIGIGWTALSTLVGLFIGPGLGSLQTLFTWLRIFFFIVLGQSAMTITGYWYCLRVPEKHGCRKLALAVLVVGSLELALITLLDPLNLAGLYFDSGKFVAQIDEGKWSGLNQLLAGITSWLVRLQVFFVLIQVLGYAHLFLMPMFLWSMARCLRARWQEERCLTLAKVSIGGMCLALFFQVFFRFIHVEFLLFIVLPFFWVMFVIGISETVLTFLILINIRRAIEDRVDL
jgi:hypothetical protein